MLLGLVLLLRVLKAGQHYKVGLELQMPTSYTNRRVGVFMVRVKAHRPFTYLPLRRKCTFSGQLQ